MRLHALTYLVDDYDLAIDFFTRCLDFQVIEDTALTESKRWVLVGPRGGGSCMLLAKADGVDQHAALGKAAGGRVAYFLHSTDFATDHARMIQAGVRFREAPRHEVYGTVAVFDDLYGNGWDLIEPAQS